MANNHLHEVRRFQKIAGLLKEEDDLDLSDTPEFIGRDIFYIIDKEGVEPPLGPYSRDQASKVLQYLDTDGYTIISRDEAEQIYSNLEEEDDLDLSDTPEFGSNVKLELRSAFIEAGVDLNRPIFVVSWLPDVEVRKYDNPLDYGAVLQKDINTYEEYGESVELSFSTNPQNPSLDRKNYDEVNSYGPVKGYENFPPTAVGKLQVYTQSADFEQEEGVVFQEPEETLDENENDLDLSDTPQFNTLGSQIKFNLKKAGVDITRPFWIRQGSSNKELVDIDELIELVDEHIDTDLSDFQIEYDIVDESGVSGFSTRKKHLLQLKLTVIIKCCSPYFNEMVDEIAVYQAEDLSEDDGFDLSDTPEFSINYEDDLGFVEWLGDREIEDVVVGADHDYDIYSIGMRVLDDYVEKDPGLLKRIYKNYLKYKKRYGIK